MFTNNLYVLQYFGFTVCRLYRIRYRKVYTIKRRALSYCNLASCFWRCRQQSPWVGRVLLWAISATDLFFWGILVYFLASDITNSELQSVGTCSSYPKSSTLQALAISWHIWQSTYRPCLPALSMSDESLTHTGGIGYATENVEAFPHGPVLGSPHNVDVCGEKLEHGLLPQHAHVLGSNGELKSILLTRPLFIVWN